MLRFWATIAICCALCGCGPSVEKEAPLRESANREAVALAQEKEISLAVTSLDAIELFPEDIPWNFRYQAQEHLTQLEGKNVLVNIQVRDAVMRLKGLVVSGEPKSYSYPLLIWIRLHGIKEETIRGMNNVDDDLACIGLADVTVPAGPYLEMRSVNVDEVEVQTMAIPLIVDVNCVAAWHRVE